MTTLVERNWPLDIDPVHKHSKSDGKAAGDLATKMTALKIDQAFINSSAIDTCSSGERCIGRCDGRHGGSQGYLLQW
jgi:hypothetical protein